MNDQPTPVRQAAARAPGDEVTPVRRRTRLAKVLLLLIVLAAIAGAVGYWYLTRNEATTDDAYTDGNAVTVAPQVAGAVIARDVTDNEHVKAGQVLVEIDPRPYQAARDQAAGALQVAEAQLAAARVNLETARITWPAKLAAAQAQLLAAQAIQFKAQADERRQRSLPKQATTQQDIDNAESALRNANAAVAVAQANLRATDIVRQSIDQAEAQVHQLEGQVALSQAQLAQAELNLEWTKVRAPQDGWVTKRNVDKGNYVQVGEAIMALVTSDVWVTANFKEGQLALMRRGDPVDIDVDAYPDLHLVGHVDSIQLGSGSRFSAFPAENATGNFVKIVQRVPVKIVIDSGLDPNRPLPLGLSVEPVVHLSQSGRG
ncbi:MAG TPA: HlyD family secretion protein [Acetobacteraceae bacterium]|nr:HlyD family secretion protein [Acetobacteraceae bacterium]